MQAFSATRRQSAPLPEELSWALLCQVPVLQVVEGDLDARLASRGVYVALAQRKALYVAGSRVTGLAANDALGGFVDLAAVGVK